MPISGNVPNHLVVGARTGFLSAVSNPNLPWQRVAGLLNMDAKSETLVDLGAAPMPIEGTPVIKDFIEKTLTVKARDWSTVVGISHNAVKDDQTGRLETKVRSAGERFQMHLNGMVFKALDAGDGSTYGLCYDGLSFFNDAHVDKGAAYTTTQDNNFALALSLDNFTTNLNLAAVFRDDQGELTEHAYNTIITCPTLRRTAAQITSNAEDYGTASRAINPYNGEFTQIISAHMNTTAWIVAATSETAKPIYVAMREQPNLQDAWYDPLGADGGMFWFKFYARYNVVYGDWRLAFMGNT